LFTFIGFLNSLELAIITVQARNETQPRDKEMSARHVARVLSQRAQEHPDSSDDDYDAPKKPIRPAFQLPVEGDDDDNDSEEEALPLAAAHAEAEDDGAHPGAAPAEGEDDDLEDEDGQPPQAKATKKKKKKKKNSSSSKPSSAGAVGEPDDDDDERAVLEEAVASNSAGSRAAAIAAVWIVSAGAVDADGELKRRFGGKAVRAVQREGLAASAAARGTRGPPAPRRVLLVTPKPEWGRPHGLLKMESRALGDAKLFEFVWSDEYVRLQRTLASLVLASADPNMLMELLHHEPCHIGALLQLHDVATHTGQVRGR
jgi:hypothetical protein